MRSSKEMRGTRVLNKKGKKMGKIDEVIFAPKEQRVIGYMVKRPDFLLMFVRKNKFLAADRLEFYEKGILPIAEKGTWDTSAYKRLGLSADDCIIWRNMPVVTADGQKVGRVSDLAYDEFTGNLLGVRLSEGAMATALVGIKDIPASMIISCDKTGVTVREQAIGVDASGGVAAVSGEAAAMAGQRISSAAAVTTEKAGDVIDRASSMFGSFMDEFKQAMDSSDEDE